MYHYSVPPAGYVRYEYATSPTSSPSSSPAPDPAYTYYVPPQYKAAPMKEYSSHSRKQSYGTPKRPGGWHSADYPSAVHHSKQPVYNTQPVKLEEPVSRDFDRVRIKTRRYSSTTAEVRGGGTRAQYGYSSGDSRGPTRYASVRTTPKKQTIVVDTSDSADDSSPHFSYMKPPKQDNALPKYPKHRQTNSHSLYNQASPVYAARGDDSRRPQSSGHSRRVSAAHQSYARSTKRDETPREATATDALKHGVPAGYSLKNWDPDEAPVMLLGSVFDANSLGKWIYDWTVFHHGPATPMSEVAGDLWLLLIKLAHKMKRADLCVNRIEDDDDYEMVEDFLESGDRLWTRFKKVLKQCEEFMWKAARKEGVKGNMKGSLKMGKTSGCEFVDSIFGRDRELEETESLMQSIRLWNVRFDANCEEILRSPRR